MIVISSRANAKRFDHLTEVIRDALSGYATLVGDELVLRRLPFVFERGEGVAYSHDTFVRDLVGHELSIMERPRADRKTSSTP